MSGQAYPMLLIARASFFRLFCIVGDAVKHFAIPNTVPDQYTTVCLSLTLKRKKATMPLYQLVADTGITQHSKSVTRDTN